MCFADRSKPCPLQIQVLAHFDMGHAPFLLYKDHLDVLERRWAHIQPAYGMPEVESETDG